MVLADVRRSWTGAIAVLLLVALAVGLGVAVSMQERALRQGSARAADPFDLLIGAPGSEAQLVLTSVYLQPAAPDLIDGRILAELEDDERVGFASPIGFGDNYEGYPIVGVTPAFARHLTGEDGPVFARIDEALIGSQVRLEIGDSFVPVHGRLAEEEGEAHEELPYRVVGRMPRLGNPWDRAIIVPIEAVWFVHAMPFGHAVDEAALFRDGGIEIDFDAIPIGPPWDPEELPGVPSIVVQPASLAGAYQLRQTYRSRDDTMAVFPAEVLIRLYELLGDVRNLVALISVLTQVLVMGAVLLAVLATLAQRRRLIGVLRALGASRSFVFVTVWLNVATLLTLGSALGLAAGWVMAFGVGRIFEAETGIALPVIISLSEINLILIIVAIGIALATIPAALTYRGSVSAALRA
jgi:putative ABC transport system permease protein